MKREDGYYWVKDKEEGWMIAEWVDFGGSVVDNPDTEWYICGAEYGLQDVEWDEIDERRITRPKPLQENSPIHFHPTCKICKRNFTSNTEDADVCPSCYF